MSQTAPAKKGRISHEHLNRLESGCYDPAVGVRARIRQP